jgi:hypothetical protein
LHYVLTGLRPTDEEVRVFEVAYAADADLAVAREADRLLGSVRYGERWGRHWLDVARFGESNGNDGLGRNPTFSHAWRYRDYVIDAFNVDLPYDRFLTEQIAGDLLEACSSEEGDRWLVATGFLAIGAKPAKAMNDNFEMDVVADQIAAVGSGILGISVGCARCHDHKHDPVSTRDYYALAGIFKSTETLWGPAAYEALTAPQTPLHVLVAAARSPVPAPESLPQPKKKDEKKPAKAAFPQLPGTPLAMGVRDARKVGDCKINIGGESKKLGPEVPRGFLSAIGGLGVELGLGSGRLELARWLTRPEPPLTARVMVNRVWHWHFGKGIVATPNDFGRQGEEPTHPELLDWLAAEFVESGWSLKKLHRMILLSETYQLSSEAHEGNLKIDANNRYLWRMNRQRLDAETLRDAVLAVSGELNLKMGGRPVVPRLSPEEYTVMWARNQWPESLEEREQTRRSVYLYVKRAFPLPMFTTFDAPDTSQSCSRRENTTVAPQALTLLNGEFMVKQAKVLAGKAGDVDGLWRRVYGRGPTAAERERAERVANREQLALVLLNTNEFLYVD